MKKIDPELMESWRRHPLTAEFLSVFSEESCLDRYRGATDLVSLGYAQGWDLACRTIHKMAAGKT